MNNQFHNNSMTMNINMNFNNPGMGMGGGLNQNNLMNPQQLNENQLNQNLKGLGQEGYVPLPITKIK